MSRASKDRVEEVASRGPRVSTVRTTSIGGPAFRLDAKYYQGEFTLATARVHQSGFALRQIADIAKAFVPGRAKLITVPHPEAGAPYLKAHDAFKIRPESDRYMAASRMRDYDSYILREGMILTPSSGRNLGPTAYVGKSLAGFAMTDIMRIEPVDEELGYYLLAYLRTPTGQALIRRGRTGTNIDHLSPADVLAIPVIWLDDRERGDIASKVKRAEQLLDDARTTLNLLEEEFHNRAGLPLPTPPGSYLEGGEARAFSVNSSSLTLRLDAEFYDSGVENCRRLVMQQRHARLADLAELRLLGRYKRYYVDCAHGTPILSGTHLLQLFPVNLRCISERSFTRPDDFLVRSGWTIFTCDGRAEEGLASPAFCSSYWDGWMASNHVMRAIPRSAIPPGFLYLALRSPYVQVQLKTRATGSVIDALDPGTVADTMVPILSESDMLALGEAAALAWEQVADALRLTTSTVSNLERRIISAYERTSMQ